MLPALRPWRRKPALSLAIIFTLAIAIGANTAAFSVLRSVLLAPLPYPDPSRLAVLWTEDPAHNVHQEGVSYPNYADWRAMNHSFVGLAFFIRTTYSQVNVGHDSPERVQSAEVSSNFFGVIGVAPAQGRAFSEQDLKAGAHLVILSAELAARRLGSANVIGQSIEIEGRPSTIIGVMPAGFHFPDADTEVWRPYTDRIPYQPVERERDYLCVLGRLKPGATIASARADMVQIGHRLEQAYPNMPDSFNGFGVNVVPLYEHIYGTKTRPALWLITAVAICVLLIAISNVANLLLASLESRDREFSMRVALGAGLGRLARQILAETAALASIGALLGVTLAFAGLRAMVHFFADRLPRLNQASIDPLVLVVALLLTLAACLATTLAPFVQLRRDRFVANIRQRSAAPLKRIFGIAQIALASALLASAGLLLRSYSLVERLTLGYNPAHLLVFDLVTRSSGPDQDVYATRVARELQDRLANAPGVIGVATAGDLFQRRNPDWQIYLEGRDSKPNDSPLADDIVSAGFFRVMGAPLLEGRLFTPEEELDKKRTFVIINEAMAHKFWPGVDPIGKRFATSPPGTKQNWHTVIGVVGTLQTAGRESDPLPQIYWAIAGDPDLRFIVRTSLDSGSMLASVRQLVHTIDSAAVVYHPTTVEAQLDNWISSRRLNTTVVTVFSFIATLLAAIGVFSLLHYATAIRTREFGVRFALGATACDVLTQVIGEGVSLAAIGALIGSLAAIAAGRAFSTLLFGVRPWDAQAIGLAIAAILLLAAIASAAPALRAARLNPSEALRSE